MRTPRSTRSSTPSDVSAGRGGTPGHLRGFTRGASRVRPGARLRRVRPSASGAIPGCSRARRPGPSSGPGSYRFPHDRAGPGDVRPRGAPAPYDRARPGRVRPGGSGRSATRADPDRNRRRQVRTTYDPHRTRTGQDGPGPAGRLAHDREGPPRRAPRVRPRGPAPVHDLRGPGRCTTAGVCPCARPAWGSDCVRLCGVRAVCDRVGGLRWATCSGRGVCDPRGARTAYDRAAFELRTAVRGPDCAPPCGVRAGCDPGGFRPDATAPGLGPVRPRRSTRAGSRGSVPAQTVRSRAAYDRARRRPGTARACFACVRPCGACPAYDPVRGFDHVRPEGPLRSAR